MDTSQNNESRKLSPSISNSIFIEFGISTVIFSSHYFLCSETYQHFFLSPNDYPHFWFGISIVIHIFSTINLILKKRNCYTHCFYNIRTFYQHFFLQAYFSKCYQQFFFYILVQITTWYLQFHLVCAKLLLTLFC